MLFFKNKIKKYESSLLVKDKEGFSIIALARCIIFTYFTNSKKIAQLEITLKNQQQKLRCIYLVLQPLRNAPVNNSSMVPGQGDLVQAVCLDKDTFTKQDLSTFCV